MQTRSLLLSFAPLFIWNGFCGVTLLYYFVTHGTRPYDPEVTERGVTKILSVHLRRWWLWLNSPLIRACIRWRITPNTLTTFGLLLSLSAAFAFSQGFLSTAGWFLIFGGTCDFYDGKLARALQLESKRGHYYDGMVDRIGEGLVFVGIIVYYLGNWMAVTTVIALLGCQLVSYARARGEILSIKAEGGLMQRPERVVYLGASSVLAPILSVATKGALPLDFLTTLAIIFIAILSWITTLHRMRYIMQCLETPNREIDS